jgi:phage tail sheath protein FI
MATPGYPELIGEMITLNNDRGLTAFIVGDSPMRLQPNTTAISNWATNVNLAVEDNDLGLVSRDEYLGVYYPSGFSSDNAGNNIVVPASHMALRTIALNDQVAYPWFAPAGTRRGGVTNATASGYISSEGEFVSVALNEGQRDTLYQNNVNPITFLNGAGLVVFGQKTRARNASALDRVNVARLVIYLRSQLKTLAKPYIFEPNDKITRDEIKQQVESLMVELIGLRAIYDYLVVCDETNNTPSRIDRNELYVDIAIEPVKAVEFIYIPLRLKNTGEIAGL